MNRSNQTHRTIRRSVALTLVLATGAALASTASATPTTPSAASGTGPTPFPTAAYVLHRQGERRSESVTDMWAWAERLERELCARYGDTSCD
jgi:hypothetical protein